MNNSTDTLTAARQRLRGPVAPLKIPFLSDGSIDLDSLQSHVDWLCNQGVPILLLTYGTTEYICLDEAEIEEINIVVSQVNARRAMFITSSDFWPVNRTLKYIDQARECGADAVKVQLNWKFDYGDKGIIDYYRQVAEGAGDYPLLAYTDGRTGMSMEVLQALTGIPSIIGMKNDSDPGEAGYQAFLKAAAPGLEIMSGGTMRNFLTGWPLGARTYLCAFAPFAPHLSLAFYDALENGNLQAAKRYMDDYETPLFELYRDQGYFWQLFARGLNVVTGHFPHPRARRPYPDLRPDQLEAIRQGLQKLDLLS